MQGVEIGLVSAVWAAPMHNADKLHFFQFVERAAHSVRGERQAVGERLDAGEALPLTVGEAAERRIHGDAGGANPRTIRVYQIVEHPEPARLPWLLDVAHHPSHLEAVVYKGSFVL